VVPTGNPDPVEDLVEVKGNEVVTTVVRSRLSEIGTVALTQTTARRRLSAPISKSYSLPRKTDQ
jgi:hypothetical protein